VPYRQRRRAGARLVWSLLDADGPTPVADPSAWSRWAAAKRVGCVMATADDPAAVSQPPFPLERPTSASWREQALSKIAELRFVRDWMLRCLGDASVSDQAKQTIVDHLQTATDAAKGGSIWNPRNFVAALTGSGVERVISQLDAVESELLRIAPSDYLRGEISSLLAHVQLHLEPTDPRRIRLETIAQRVVQDDDEHSDPAVAAGREERPSQRRTLRFRAVRGARQGRPAESTAQAPEVSKRGSPGPLSESDRQAVISAVRAASSESRWKVSRLRSFRNVIAVAALVLTVAAVGMVVFAFRRPADLPVCFTPANVVCTTSTSTVPPIPDKDKTESAERQDALRQETADKVMREAASGWDVAVVELVGLVAAAIAAAAAVRKVRGTSTPYSLPVALAVLKLPTGALTALLGLLLMRGGFVPGLSALDSSAQIIAWALVFGYSQQLLTRFIDNQAQTVLEGAGGNTESLAAPTQGRSSRVDGGSQTA
jgi:hypothetical protein